MTDKNPCECCERRNLASGCSHCALDGGETTCSNSDCFINYEGSCLIGIADECKASPEFEDKKYFHDCYECVRFTKKKDSDGVEYYTCGEDGAQVGLCDDICDKFEEAVA